MPASEVMNLYRQHKLHSGPGGPVVKKKKQAVAIQISMARKEGHHIPVKGSFQQGGLVPETGNYQVHEGEEVKKQMPMYGRRPVRLEDTGLAASSKRMPFESDPKLNLPPRKSIPPVNANLKRVPPTGWGTSSGQLVSGPTEEAQRSTQEKDIAARTNQAQHDEWNRAMHQKEDFGGAMGRGRPSDMLGQPPQPRDIPPAGNDPHYAVEGLKGNVAQRMREQGERAAGIRGSFDQGGTVQQTGDYQVHQGEELMPPPERVSAPGATTSIENPPKKVPGGSGVGGNPALERMEANVSAPLQRASSNFDAPPASYKTGGTIPRTGVYRLHQGETVIPKSLASQYRKAKHG